jgi:glycosyltransferase involved in cell wall biosynthesis
MAAVEGMAHGREHGVTDYMTQQNWRGLHRYQSTIRSFRVGIRLSMRIAWFSHRDWTHPRAGGAEQSVRRICTELALRGHQVTVVSGTAVGGPGLATDSGIRLVRAPGPIGPHLLHPLLLWGGGFDVAVDDLSHVVPWGTEFIGRLPGVAFFRHLHARTLAGQVTGFARRTLMAIERTYPLIYPRWTFVAPTQEGARDLHSLGVNMTKIEVIPYGTDKKPQAAIDTIDPPQLIYFSGLKVYKRPHFAIEVLRRLRLRGVPARLIITGEGPLKARLQDQAKGSGVDNWIRFVGRVSEGELAELLRRSWVHIQCSTAEGWGLTASEAAALGVPTVGFDVPGVREAVRHGRTGLLVPDGSVQLMTESVESVIQSIGPWRLRCLGASAKMPSWGDVALMWENLLERSFRD